jgi:hypothetical protein
MHNTIFEHQWDLKVDSVHPEKKCAIEYHYCSYKVRRIPHYIIENRNLFNSKLTEKMSEEIVDVLSKYDTTHVFTLDAFEHIFKLTQYNNALLKHRALISTIMACFDACVCTFSYCVFCPSYLCGKVRNVSQISIDYTVFQVS